ncbi:MAG: pilus assembly protein PilM [Planctomycetota bacterium]|nr:pilus assembly protein PilM [Planctomycetota bacterium]
MFFQKNKNRGIIGIDFGTHSVKVAQIVTSGSRLGIKDAAIIPRAEVWPNDLSGEPSGISSLGELDTAFTLNQNFSGRAAACTMSMAVCDVRRMSIPQADIQLKGTHIENELSTIERFKGVQREFDFWEIDRAVPGGELPANVLSLPTFWANQCMDDINAAKMRCDLLDGVPFANARAFSLFEDSSDPVALLDWGYSRATLSVIHDGQPKFVRILRKSGFRFVVDQIRQGFGLDALQSQEVIRQYGLESITPARINHRQESPDRQAMAIQQSVHNLVLEPINAISSEISRTVDFLRNQQSALSPVKLVLFGGGATLRNVAPLLEKKVRMKTEVWGNDLTVGVPGGLSLPVMANAIAMSAAPLIYSQVETAKVAR